MYDVTLSRLQEDKAEVAKHNTTHELFTVVSTSREVICISVEQALVFVTVRSEMDEIHLQITHVKPLAFITSQLGACTYIHACWVSDAPPTKEVHLETIPSSKCSGTKEAA